jgi:tRNA-splicing endonuclease subunit Sen54
MALTPFYSPLNTPETLDCPPSSGLTITYHVYKSSPFFKKTDPGPPDFYISVVNARELGMFGEEELSMLLQQTPFHPPDRSKSDIYGKVKTGVRNFVLAVVDQGVTSFLNISDAAFGHNALWARPKPNSNRGGFKRGGFKGRHRSR